MEAEEKENPVQGVQELTVDFSKQSIKKIERASTEQQQAEALILDDNDIQRLDNLDSYSCLKKLSLVNNQLIRMYGVSCLVYLEVLDISNNSLVTIEGLKDLRELKILNLAKNKIKTIEHLNTNLKLEKLDLSENSIAHISDISFLGNLRELSIHGNRISHLKSCEKNLPENLEVLKLNNNAICDLNEISFLGNLSSLKELCFSSNPCVNFTEDQNLKAEWLYSQGRGRSFRPGEHAALVEYLSTVCPKNAEENDEFEDVKKLKLILSKAQLHQQQLREQLSSGKVSSIVDTVKVHASRKRSTGIPERMVASFQDPKNYRYSPELMTRSLDSGMLRNSPPSKSVQGDSNQIPLHATSNFIPIPDTLISPDVCQSRQPLIPTPQRPSSISSRTSCSSSRNSPHSTPENKRRTFTNLPGRQSESLSPLTVKKCGKINSRSSTPLRSSSRNTSSPGGRASSARERNCRETSEEEDSEISALKFLAVQEKTNKKKSDKKHHSGSRKGNFEEKQTMIDRSRNLEKELMNTEAWKAAVCIQKWWRGYRTRNLNSEVLAACKDLQISRMQDYIAKVVGDMEATRIALEGNRKLQVLQMQAINALWKKMTALQPNNAVENIKENKASLQNLVETCSSLNKQVESLQSMMKSMQGSSNASSLIPMATQTEIVAVHTPQSDVREIFPYNLSLKARLPLEIDSFKSPSFCEIKNESQHFDGNSESDSTTNTPKTVTEMYPDCNVGDNEADDSVSEFNQNAIFLGDKEKTSLNLSETVSSTKDSEKFLESADIQNEGNS